jgi:FAD/FMN-containing dehydrogenase
MLTKTATDEIQSYLSDSSYLTGGHAARLVFPESSEDVAEVLAAATRDRTPVSISGAGPALLPAAFLGGTVLATDKLNQIKSIARNDSGGVRSPKQE